ncbi:MAG TPA: murein biosynthesis integral membrane protein MurJ, partial [Pseudomonadales bacterium]
APWLIIPIAPGWYDDPGKLALAGDILRLTFPYLFLISMTAFAGSVLNSYGRFAVPAFTPILLNICLIAAALWASSLFDIPVMALGWGVMAAGLVQMLFQLPFLARIGLLPRPIFNTAHEGVRRILKLMTPALFGVSVSQINLLFDTILASFLMTGSVSWLYYSDRLVELPLGVIGIAIATVILPNLSRRHASQNQEDFARTLDWAVRMVLLIGIPSSLGLLLLAEPILVVLFEGGVFDDFTVMKSALSLRAYALGLLAFMLIKVLAPGYFARQDTKTPVKIGIKAMLLNMVFNLILIFPLAHVGLALATSLSAFFNAGLLYRGLRKAGVYQLQPGWPKFLLQLLLSSAVMLALLSALSQDTKVWLGWSGMQRTGYLTMLIGVAAGGYFSALWLTGFRRHELKV